MMSDPKAGLHYPKETADFLAWFRYDVDCRDYLDWLRWPDGFVCTVDGCNGGGWRLGDGRYMCTLCALVVVAVEQRDRGFGRIRMQRIPDAKTDTLRAFLADSVEPGSTVVTDGLVSYMRAAEATGCAHTQIVGPCLKPERRPTPARKAIRVIGEPGIPA